MGDLSDSSAKRIHELEFLRNLVLELETKLAKFDRIEQQLQFFQGIVESSPEAISVHDAENRLIYINPAFEILFQSSRVESIASNLCKFHSAPVDFIKDQQPKPTLNQGEKWEGEWEYVDASGQKIPIWEHDRALFDAQGNLLYRFSFMHDISERKKTEMALRENLEIQRAFLATIPALVYLKDKECRYIEVNRTLSELVGVPADRMRGKTDDDFFPQEDAEKFRKDDLQILETNLPLLNIEEKITRPDGVILWVSTSKTPLRDQAGNAVGIVGFTIDITDRKRMEEQFRQVQKIEAVAQLAGGVAHNVNNILTGIIGNINLAQMKAQDAIASNLSKAQEACFRAANLVNDLLVFSRKTEINPKPIDVNPIIQEVYNLARQAIDRRIELKVELLENLPKVCADASQITTILMNMCINGRDAINRILEGEIFPERQGDPFLITLESREGTIDQEGYQGRSHASPGRYVMLSVSDNGTGMDEETQRRIFEPFYTTKNTVGTGLGLASAFGSIKQHDGWIDFVSEHGVGTTFTIYLPVWETTQKIPPVTESAQNPEPLESLRGTETILLIDDEEMILSLGKQILEDYGYQVLSAVDGHEGLELFQRERDRIDLIILDLSMPKMSGHEFLEKIARYHLPIKIIISSGYSESVDMESLRQIGASDVISKPYYPKELVRIVRQNLNREGGIPQKK